MRSEHACPDAVLTLPNQYLDLVGDAGGHKVDNPIPIEVSRRDIWTLTALNRYRCTEGSGWVALCSHQLRWNRKE